MKNIASALVMRVYISSTDKYKDQLLYEYIVFKAKDFGIAGASVLKGILGFGASSVIHSYKFWEVTEKLPVQVEIVDQKEKILAFCQSIQPILENMRYGCLVTLNKTNIILYKTGKKHHQ